MSAFGRYVRIQLGTLVIGIVGPIFLATYFATQPDPTIKWMYFAGLAITTVDVLVALVLADATGPKG